MSGFSNKPKILRGAFVEYGLSIPPLFVVFQFNPVQLSRSRSLSFKPPDKPHQYSTASGEKKRVSWQTLRDLHQWDFKGDDLMAIQDMQEVTVEEEKIDFELRLDATDDLNDGDTITECFGILPRLATLELMMYPKDEGLLSLALSSLLGSAEKAFSFTRKPRPPLVLFIWGRTRVLPVNLESMKITETEFGTDLHPIRATVAVSMTVIEGQSIPFLYSKVMKEVSSLLNLANITEIANVVIPG